MPGSGFSPVGAKHFQLANGIQVTLVREDSLPLVVVKVVIRGGASASAPAAPGLANAVAELVSDGSGTLSGTATAELLDGYGASLVTGAAQDYSHATLDSLAETLPSSLDALANAVERPRFDEADVERVRSSIVGRLDRLYAEGYDCGEAVLARAIYGEQHPYGYIPLGTRNYMRSLKRADVVAFHRTNWHPGNAAIIVVGAVSSDELKALLEPRFGTWKASNEAQQAEAPPAAPKQEKVVFLVDLPDASQVFLFAGQPSFLATDADTVPADVMDGVVGGSYASRLNMKLREEKGYTYGARSYFVRARGPGYFWAVTYVSIENTILALTDFLAILRDAPQQPPTPDELDQGRATTKKVLVGQFETIAQVATALAELVAQGLPEDWHATSYQSAGKVATEDVTVMAKKYLSMDSMRIVVTGPAEKIGPGLEKFGFAPVQHVDLSRFY